MSNQQFDNDDGQSRPDPQPPTLPVSLGKSGASPQDQPGARPTSPIPQQAHHNLDPYPLAPPPSPPRPPAHPQARGYSGPYDGYPMMTQMAPRPPVSTVVAVLAWVVAAITFLYMLPWAVAVTRNRSNMGAIGLINFLLGWSFIGWVVSLVMACGSEPQPTVVVNNYQVPGYRPPGY